MVKITTKIVKTQINIVPFSEKIKIYTVMNPWAMILINLTELLSLSKINNRFY
jgi:hypothetical protein